MEIKYETVFEIYKKRLNNKEDECIMWEAQVVTLQSKIEKLEKLLKENNIDVIQ